MEFKVPLPFANLLPQVTNTPNDGLPHFRKTGVSNLVLIGEGSFGKVFRGKHDGKNVVVKQLPKKFPADEEKCLQKKEAKLLNTVRNHLNIVNFLGFSSSDHAIMMEYCVFKFHYIGMQSESVSSLDEFLLTCDKLCDYNNFEHLQMFLARDILTGLEYLHSKNIAHRDLKPKNILVSNMHWGDKPDSSTKADMWNKKPIIAKLADFGEARSLLIQTGAIINSRTTNLARGSPAYMAPEIHSHTQECYDMEGLKRMDIWSVAMVFLHLINPSVHYPYQEELKGKSNTIEALKQLLSQHQLPKFGTKYTSITQWEPLYDVFRSAAKFRNEERPGASQLLKKLPTARIDSKKVTTKADRNIFKMFSSYDSQKTRGNIFDKLRNESPDINGCSGPSGGVIMKEGGTHNSNAPTDKMSNMMIEQLPVSQTSYIEQQSLDFLEYGREPVSSGINETVNACAFLCFLVADKLIDKHLRITTIKEEATDVILNFPKDINNLRDNTKMYSVDEAHELLAGSGHIKPMDITMLLNGITNREDFKQQLEDILTKSRTSSDRDFLILTCTPYTLLIIKEGTRIFVVDTHPVPHLHGGNGSTGIVIQSSEANCISGWLTKRLNCKARASICVEICLISTRVTDNNESRQNLSTPKTNGSIHSDSSSDVEDLSSGLRERPIDSSGGSKKRRCFDSSGRDDDIISNSAEKPSNEESCNISSDCEAGISNLNERPIDSSGGSKKRRCFDSSGSDDDIISNSADVTNEQGSEWNGDKDFPVYKRTKDRFTPIQAAKTLHEASTVKKCERQPLRVRDNVSFIIDFTHFKNRDDVRADMNGVYSGVLRCGVWTVEFTNTGNRQFRTVEKKKIKATNDNMYHLHMNCRYNKARTDLTRSIFTLYNCNGEVVNNCCLLQYNIKKLDVDEFTVLPHGNSRRKGPFFPSVASAKHAIKEKISESGATVQKVLDAVKNPKARCPEENVHKKQVENYMQRKKSDDIEDMLVYAHHSDSQTIIHHTDIPSDIWVLGKQQTCEDIGNFVSTNRTYYPISIDPTFQMGRFEVTPIVYRHPYFLTKRTGEHPVFIGPTLLHHFKDHRTYKIFSTIAVSHCTGLADAPGFITDGEDALIKAFKQDMPKAVALRCVLHFQRNCKEQLSKVGIRDKKTQHLFLNEIFGVKEKNEGLIDAKDEHDLCDKLGRLKEMFEELESKEKPTNYFPKFWDYINDHVDMIVNCILPGARKNARMPEDTDRKPLRPYTNASESMNNKMGFAKRAYLGTKERHLTKLEFVKYVYEKLYDQQMEDMKLAIAGLGEKLELSPLTKYLQIPIDIWYELSDVDRDSYVSRLLKMKMVDAEAKKRLSLEHAVATCQVSEYKDLSLDLANFLITRRQYTKASAELIENEVKRLINQPLCINQQVSLDPKKDNKYDVASPSGRSGKVECKRLARHVTCKCGSYKYDQICKHSLAVAEKCNMLKNHLEAVLKNPGLKRKSDLAEHNVEKNVAGKKGAKNKYGYRVRQKSPEVGGAPEVNNKKSNNPMPYTEIYHNDHEFVLQFLIADKKNCKSCSFEFCHRNKVPPYDIVFAHQERYYFPINGDWSNKIPSKKEATRYYHVSSSCILQRFPYFTVNYVEIPQDVRANLLPCHWTLLISEFGDHFSSA